MTDDNLDKLLEGFGSELEPDSVFLSRLEKRLALADLLRQRERQQKKQLGFCLVAALLVGVALGALLVWSSMNIPMDLLGLNLAFSIGTLKVGALLKSALVLLAALAVIYLALHLAKDKLRSQIF